MDLNEPQLAAAMHTDGALLVFAGAGSGKTRVITVRIANLVARAHVPPYRILAVTFTNKAAGEMRHRLEGMLGDAARDLWVGTFHAIAAKLLRRYGEAVGVRQNFLIYDSADQRAIVTRILREFELDERRYPPRAMLSRILSEKQEGREPEQMELGSYLDEIAQRVYVEYNKRLRAANAVDFEDLILLMVRLAESESAEGEAVRRKFSHVLVDEFQDTNRMQYALLRALVREHGNLCVVGDDDQSIYRWRGADVRNIRGFRHDFPGAEVVKLEQNYRSTQRIVDSALSVIQPSREREPKQLWTENAEGDPIRVVAVADERDEAAVVLDSLRRGQTAGLRLDQMAVFYRVHAQSRVLEETLRAANLPYQIIGGTKFFDRAEVKDALSYLRLLVNPDSDVDFLRVVNQPARGIGDTAKERLGALARRRGVALLQAIEALQDEPLEPKPKPRKTKADAGKIQVDPNADDPFVPLFDLDHIAQGAAARHDAWSAGEAAAPPESAALGTAARKRLLQFHAMIRELQDDARTLAPSELLDRVLERSGMAGVLRAEDSAEAEARLENLGELRGSLSDYEAAARAAGETPSLEGFLERVSLVADSDPDGGAEAQAKVTLMTVHGAKGLEFELVVLTGMEEDLFPYRGMGQSGSLDLDALDEERRLAYVAITRARAQLVITHASTRQIFGQTRYGAPSRFLTELPAEHVEELATSARTGQGRYVDRPDWSRGGGYGAARARTTSHTPRAAGEQYVDREFFDDVPQEPDEPAKRSVAAPAPRAPSPAQTSPGELRRGSKVQHKRFGVGEVRSVVHLGEPAAMVHFPGWGELKVLSRFLTPA